MLFTGKEITLDRLYRNFEILKTWEERYKYVIELGRKLPKYPEELKIDEYYVHGCSSRVWMIPDAGQKDKGHFKFTADSDSHIVKGLIAVLMIIYYGLSPDEIVKVDIEGIFKQLGLGNHLSQTRANGFFAMVKKIKILAALHASE